VWALVLVRVVLCLQVGASSATAGDWKMVYSLRSSVLMLLLAAALLFAVAAGEGCSGPHVLGANFKDYRIPKRASATGAELGLFVAGVAGVLGVSAIVTYFKVRTGEPLPGYTQAQYMKEL
jgi:hypothetical protein